MKEKRRLERFDLRAPAKVIPIDTGLRRKELSLETRDICSGGAFFHTSHTLPEGTVVDVEVILPLDKLEIIKASSKRVHLKVSGKVVRSEASGIAVCFDEDYQICQLNGGNKPKKKENSISS